MALLEQGIYKRCDGLVFIAYRCNDREAQRGDCLGQGNSSGE
jgi:hypothetical protein